MPHSPSSHSAPPAQLPLQVAPLRFLDTETTGLRPDRGARIIEWAVLDHAAVIQQWTAAPDAPSYDAALGAGLDRLFATLQTGIVVGHHLAFDLGFLAREADRLGRAGPRLAFIDTCALARRLTLRTTDVQLATLLDYFGIDPDGPLHTARVDAQATRALFWALVDHGGLDTLADARMRRLNWAAF